MEVFLKNRRRIDLGWANLTSSFKKTDTLVFLPVCNGSSQASPGGGFLERKYCVKSSLINKERNFLGPESEPGPALENLFRDHKIIKIIL